MSDISSAIALSSSESPCFVDQFISNNQGALAQYTRLPAENLAHRPSNVSVTQAAGFSVAGLAAYQALTDIGRLKAGQALFINGGSTAVGSFAIMIAKALGARVAVSASSRNEAYVRELGADEVRTLVNDCRLLES